MSQLLQMPGASLLLKPFCGAPYDRLPPITGRTLRAVREFGGFTREHLARIEGVRERTIVNHESIQDPQKASCLSRSFGFPEIYWEHLMAPVFFTDAFRMVQHSLMFSVPACQAVIGVRLKNSIVFEAPLTKTRFHIPLDGGTVLDLARNNPNYALNLTADELEKLEVAYLLTPELDSCFGKICSVLAYMHVSETAYPGQVFVVAYNKLAGKPLQLNKVLEYPEAKTSAFLAETPAVFSDTGSFTEEDVSNIWKIVDSKIMGGIPSCWWDLLMHFAAWD